MMTSSKKMLAAGIAALGLVAAHGQNLQISPTTSTYDAMVAWSNLLGFGGSLPWARERLSRNVTEAERDILNNVDIEWEGTPVSRECADVGQLAYTSRRSGDRVLIRICLRTLMHLTEMSRGLMYLVAFPMMTGKEPDDQVANRYFEHLQEVVGTDNDRGLPYQPFCTAEFVIYALSSRQFDTVDCNKETTRTKHTKEFQAWYARGTILPPEILTLLNKKGGPTEMVMKDLYHDLATNSYRGILYSVLTHEFGHIISCHFGDIGPLKCAGNQKSMPPKVSNFDAAEFQADAWAMSQLGKEFAAIPGGLSASGEEIQIAATSLQWLLLNRMFVSLVFFRPKTMAQHEEVQARMNRHAKDYEAFSHQIADELAKENPEMAAHYRQVLGTLDWSGQAARR